MEGKDNISDVLDYALKKYGDAKISEMQCPCCGKWYYVVDSELGYAEIHREGESLETAQTFSKKGFPRCPYCGCSTIVTPGLFFDKNNKK